MSINNKKITEFENEIDDDVLNEVGILNNLKNALKIRKLDHIKDDEDSQYSSDGFETQTSFDPACQLKNIKNLRENEIDDEVLNEVEIPNDKIDDIQNEFPKIKIMMRNEKSTEKSEVPEQPVPEKSELPEKSEKPVPEAFKKSFSKKLALFENFIKKNNNSSTLNANKHFKQTPIADRSDLRKKLEKFENLSSKPLNITKEKSSSFELTTPAATPSTTSNMSFFNITTDGDSNDEVLSTSNTTLELADNKENLTTNTLEDVDKDLTLNNEINSKKNSSFSDDGNYANEITQEMKLKKMVEQSNLRNKNIPEDESNYDNSSVDETE